MAEPLNRDLKSLKNQLKATENHNETVITEKLKEIIRKAKETAESDEAEYVFGVFYEIIVGFEADVRKLRTELEYERSKARSTMREEERPSLLPDGDRLTWREAVGGALAAVCGGKRGLISEV